MNQQYALEAPLPQSAVPPAQSESAHNDTFHDPQTFLKILQDRAPRISPLTGGQMSKNDLVIYSQTASSDPVGENAAAIAAKHFDDLDRLSENGSDTKGYLNRHDLQTDLKHYNGETGLQIVEETLGNAVGAGAVGLATLGMGVATVFAFAEAPVLGVIAAVDTLGGLLVFGKLAEGSVHAWRDISANARDTRETFASWAEINNGVGRPRPTSQTQPAASQKPSPSTQPLDAGRDPFQA
jgi:hypothetical protein